MLFQKRLTVCCFIAAFALVGQARTALAVFPEAAVFADAAALGGKSSLTLTSAFSAASADVGLPLQAYLLALVPTPADDVVYARNAQEWVHVGAAPQPTSIPAWLSTVGTTRSQALPIIDNMDVRDIPGTRVYLGYGLDTGASGAAFEEMLRSQRYRLIHTVSATDTWNDTGVAAPWALRPVNATALTAYFRTALAADSTNYLYPPMLMPSLIGVAVATTSGTPPAAANFSATTVQEAGVDEADLIKTDGHMVFSLDPASSDSTARRERVRRQRINDAASNASAAALTPVDTLPIPFSADVGGSGLYLDSQRQQLIAIAQAGSGYGIYDTWFQPYYWSQGQTEAVLIDTTDARQMKTRRSVRISGQLIGSRRVAATLYLVVRHYPRLPGLDPVWSSLPVEPAGSASSAAPDDPTTANQSRLDMLQATDVLPTIAIDGGPAQALVDAAACLVQPDNASGSADIITIVAIDLAAAEHRHAARCFTGGAEAFYMSEQSLYLATTRSHYDHNGAFPLYAAATSTDLHKFSLDGLNIVYRGSGNVAGHLGFDQNRKSFRMGEHQGLLRVVTQIDSQFAGWIGGSALSDSAPESPTRLNILQETAGTLAVVGSLPNSARPAPLGKPGEQLYASRFIGARGYLVTFRLTDPLYVLDLSVPTDPKLTGELEVSGYSDYLFPLDDTLLLGVGKDAIADGTSGDGRSAWYQGIKVALIDVSDPSQPREAAHTIIGRRGTHATVLADHHGIALQTHGRTVRVSLPVSVHDTPSPYATGMANDYFAFSRTELQKFAIDLDTRTLRQLDPLPSSLSTQRDIANDRALLWNEQVHYYQDGNWRASLW